jgi:hypothetical protein
MAVFQRRPIEIENLQDLLEEWELPGGYDF